MLNDVSSDIIYPLLPVFLSAQLGATPIVIGMIEGLADALSSILKLFAGTWSDRMARRKPLIITGYAIAAASRYLLATSGRWVSVLSARLADRTGKGIRSAPRDAMISDVTPVESRGKAFGFHRAMDHTGALIGPLLAALMVGALALPLRTIFLIAIVPSVIGVAIIAVFLKERRRDSETIARANENVQKLPREFAKPMRAIALFYLANSSDIYLLLHAHLVGIETRWIPLLWAANHAVKAVLSTAGGALSDRTARNRVLATGWMIYALIYYLFPFAKSVWAFAALFVVYAIPFSLTEGTERAWVADYLHGAVKGKAFGVYYLVQGMCTLAGTALFGLYYEYVSVTGAFHLGAGIAVVAAITAFTTDKREAGEPSAAQQ